MNPERLIDLLRTDRQRVKRVLKDRPENPQPDDAIPLAPVVRPTEPIAASIHDIAYGGSETPFAIQGQKLFAHGGIIPPDIVAKLHIPPTPMRSMVEIGDEGEIISPPIIKYFQNR